MLEYAFSTPTPYIKEFLFPILSVETSVWILHFCTVCLSVCEWVCLCAGMDDSKSFSLLGPYWSAIVQAQRLSLCGHIARMPDKTDARSIITAFPSENWRRPPGRPRTTWMKTIKQDLRSNNLSLDEAITVAQNRPLWRLMSAFGATHP